MKIKIDPMAYAMAYAFMVPLGLGCVAHWTEVSAVFKSPTAAGWAAAAGTIIALGVAIYVGHLQAHAALKVAKNQIAMNEWRENQNFQAVVGLVLGYALSARDEMSRALDIPKPYWASPEGFTNLERALDAIPAHSLPDAKSALTVVQIRAAVERFHKRHQRERGNAGPIHPNDVQDLRYRMKCDIIDVSAAITTLEVTARRLNEVAASLPPRDIR